MPPPSLPTGPTCTTCVLGRSGRGFTQLSGTGSNGVMLVGDSLTDNEALKNIPFTGSPGYMLDRILTRHVKEPRENFYIANAISCKPPGGRLKGEGIKKPAYYYRALEQCKPNLSALIDLHKPKAIVTLGEVALEQVLGMRDVQAKQNYAYWSDQYNCWVVPAHAPAFVQQGQNRFQPVVGFAIKKALRIAAEGYSYETFRVITEPNVAELTAYLQRYKDALRVHPGIPLAFDIETDYKGERDESTLQNGQDPSFTILQISFAFGPFEGIALEWNAVLKPLIQALFDVAPVATVWNRSYDVPRIEANGVHINAPIRDSMIAWHVLNSDLNMGLGFATPLIPGNHQFPQWKDTNSDEGGWYYSALDSIALWRNDDSIMRSLKKMGALPYFQQYVEQVRPVLDDMEKAGMLVDTNIQAQFSARMEVELVDLLAQMQAVVPDVLLNNSPAEGYKRDPIDTTGLRRITVPNQRWTMCPVCRMKNPPKPHFKTFKAKKSLHKNTACSGERPSQMSGDEIRWTNMVPFKPSTKQLIGYALHKGYTIKRNWKTKKYTMDKEAREALTKKNPTDPLLLLVGAYKSSQKLYGLYGPKGIYIGDDGRVHTNFSDRPSTLRFSSYDPNMQNIPRGNPEKPDAAVNYIRDFFVAPPGCTLGARDYSGVEAVLVGYFAGDRDYVRLAKIGVHDYFNAHRAYEAGDILAADLPDLSWSDADLKECLYGFKQSLKSTRPVAKSAVHGSNYLETPFMMFRVAPDLYENTAAAKRVQDQYFGLFPAIPEWQAQTCALADKQGYVLGPYKVPHRFYQVYEWALDKETQKWGQKLGPDAKRAVAYRPQHTAASIMRRSILLLGATFVRQYLRLTVHDELLWETPIDLNEQVDNEVKRIMELPQPELPLPADWQMGEFLTIGTEAKFGQRWGKMC